MLAADTCFVRVLVVGCGLCDFFVLLCFVCSRQHGDFCCFCGGGCLVGCVFVI